MSRFYVPAESVKGDKINITGDEAHHILDVMRLKESDRVVTFDGTGKEYVGVIKQVLKYSLVVKIEEVRSVHSGKEVLVTLIQAIPKKEKMDYIVEKATELGVGKIVPVVTERTVVKWDGPKRSDNVERWRKIALAAAKQCGRRDIPEIKEIVKFADCLKAGKSGAVKIIAALSEKAVPLKEALKGSAGKDVTIAIGPEGDFTEKEVAAAEGAGFRVISLGPRVLKSDTAGLFAVSAINYEFSDK